MAKKRRRKAKRKQRRAPNRGVPAQGPPTGGPAAVDDLLKTAVARHQAGDGAAAAALYEKVLEIDPDQPDALHLLGVLACQDDDPGRGAELIERAVRLSPDQALYNSNLGAALRGAGRLDDALAACDRAIALDSGHPDAHANRATVLRERGAAADAEAACRRALTLSPNHPGAWNTLGLALRDGGKLTEAIDAYHRAIEARPDHAEALNNLGRVLQDAGDVSEAIDSFRGALAHRPDYRQAHGNLLLARHYEPGIDPGTLKAAHIEWGRQFADPLTGSAPVPIRDRDPDRRLRVGFISADLARHPVGFFLAPYLAHRDAASTEVFAYANRLGADRMTEWLKAHVDHWETVVGMTDETLADRIRSDGIDILVDLSGHTARNRLLVFARKPAPVQATWIGYPDTTGLTAMDYLIADRWVIPEGAEDEILETPVRLPAGNLCYAPPPSAPAIGPPPAASRGHLTFGSFNNLAKVTDETVDVWAKVLRAIPDAALIMKARVFDDEAVRDRYRTRFAGAGIAADRLTLIGASPTHAEHLAHFNQVDVALDPFPYNGATTTCEALYMGVPVINRRGRTIAGRQGESILTRIGLADWVADSDAGYVDRAVRCDRERESLAGLRRGMRKRMLASALCDGPRFARSLDAAFRGMWKNWCEGGAHGR